ncbi:MAG: TrbC/VirB2 family protein [Candidatus Komeilibacteria bacterium]
MIKKIINYIGTSSLLLFTALSVHAETTEESIHITNPLTTESPQELVGLIIKAVLGLTGTIALIYFIIGGFMWMTASGNMDKIKKGKDTLIWATLGIVIIFSAYSILAFIFEIIPAN